MKIAYKWNAATNQWSGRPCNVTPDNGSSNVVAKQKDLDESTTAANSDDITIATTITTGTNSTARALDLDDDDDDTISCSSNGSQQQVVIESSTKRNYDNEDEEKEEGDVDVSPSPVKSLNYRDSVTLSRKDAIEINYNKIRLIEFYKKHNPSRVASVEETLVKHAGKEDELLRKIKAKYGEEKAASLILTKASVCDDFEDSDSDDDDDHDDAPMSAQMQQRLNNRKKNSFQGFSATDSMKLIPSFDDDSDDDDDEGDIERNSDAAVRKQRNSDSELSALTKTIRKENEVARRCSEPILSRPKRDSFGVPSERRTSTTKMKGQNPPAAERSNRRRISFNEDVTLNHIDNFKLELSKKEQEDVWYTDVELVIMKVDCGLFNKAAENQQKKQREQQIHAQRSTQISATNQKQKEKMEAEKAKQLRKKYGIDKKVKQINKGKAAASPSVTTSTSDKKKKKKTLSSLFGKKK